MSKQQAKLALAVIVCFTLLFGFTGAASAEDRGIVRGLLGWVGEQLGADSTATEQTKAIIRSIDSQLDASKVNGVPNLPREQLQGMLAALQKVAINEQDAAARSWALRKTLELKSFLDPTNTALASAAKNAAAQENKANILNCDPGLDNLGGLLSRDCRLLWLSGLMSDLVWLFTWITAAANEIFNYALRFSVRDFRLLTETQGLKDAWGVARNIVDIGLIFILLYIAITTILGDSGAQKMIKSVIIVALLVNFSSFFTKIIIDTSNVIANSFYTMAAKDASGNVQYTKWGAPDLSSRLVLPAIGEGGGREIFGKIAQERGGASVFASIIFTGIGQISLNLITSVVLVAGAIMFVVRIITLLFLITLSPFAFFMSILPKTQEYANKWWRHLIDQCLFAPVYLFLLWVTITMITAQNNPLLSAISGNTGSKAGWVGTIVYFMVVNSMMLASLIVAKQFGAFGADTAHKAWGKIAGTARKYAWGGTVGAVGGALGFAAQRTGEVARRYAGQAAESLQESQGRAARFAKRLPFVNRLTGRMGAIARGGISKKQSEVEKLNLSDTALRNRMAMVTISREERAAIANILAGRNALRPQGRLTQTQIQQAATTQAQVRGQARPVQVAAWQYSSNPVDRARAITGQPSSAPGGRVPPMAAATVAQLNLTDYFDDVTTHGTPSYVANQGIREAMYQNFRQPHVEQLQTRTDDAVDRFIRNLRQDFIRSPMGTALPAAPSVDDLVNWLRAPSDPVVQPDPVQRGMNNPQLASWANSPMGRNILTNYGF